MYLPIQISKTKVKVAYNKGLEKTAKPELGSKPNQGECDFKSEGVGFGDLELKIELAKMEYGMLFAKFFSYEKNLRGG